MEIVAFQVDLGRQKESISFLKSLADFVKEHHYNTIVLYLENCVRTEYTQFFNKDETYSMEEMSEIISYMEGIGLDVIPAFENLGHMEKFLDYEELKDFAEVQDCSKEGRGWWYPRYVRGQNGCVSNAKLRAFMDKYVSDVSSLFHSKYIHMGLDEIFDFAICPKCKQRISNGETKEDMFVEHILHCHELVTSLGKRMMMWDDFFEYLNVVDRLPRDIVMCTWYYGFTNDEIWGKWTNRVKRDPFRVYDELGFEYLFCTYAHNAGSTYNVDSLTAYAEKFTPKGALMTSWERASSFFQGQLPLTAYAGELWTGNINSYEDKVALYASILGGNKDCAKLILSLQVPVFMGAYTDINKFVESDYLLKNALRDQYSYALEKLEIYLTELEEGEAKYILTDIYDYIYDIYLSLKTQELGVELFNNYEKQTKPCSYFVDRALEIKNGYEKIKGNSDKIWKRYRADIKSCNNAYEDESLGKIKRAEQLAKDLENYQECGILYFDTMMHDAYSTVKAEIRVKYNGEDGEKLIHKGAIKPTVAFYEMGGCYGFRFKTENKPIEYAVLEVYGEGALWPLSLRYMSQGTKVSPVKVEKLYGIVSGEENLLVNDTNFATMGNNSAIAHIMDGDLWRKKSAVKLIF